MSIEGSAVIAFLYGVQNVVSPAANKSDREGWAVALCAICLA